MSSEGRASPEENGWVNAAPHQEAIPRPAAQRAVRSVWPRGLGRACSREGRQRAEARPARHPRDGERRSSRELQAVPRNGTSPRTEEPGRGAGSPGRAGEQGWPGTQGARAGLVAGRCVCPALQDLAEGQDPLGGGGGLVGVTGSWDSPKLTLNAHLWSPSRKRTKLPSEGLGSSRFLLHEEKQQPVCDLLPHGPGGGVPTGPIPDLELVSLNPGGAHREGPGGA